MGRIWSFVSQVSVVLGVAAFINVDAIPEAQAAVAGKIHTPVTSSDPVFLAATKFAELVKERTNGEVVFTVFPNGQLASGDVDAAAAARLGSIEALVLTPSTFAEWVPEVTALSLPFLFRNCAHMSAVRGQISDFLGAKLEAQGFRYLDTACAGDRIPFSKKQIKTLADLAGMKMRTQQNPVEIELYKALGANPTPLPFPELYTSLETGVVDMADGSRTSYVTYKFNEIAPYVLDLRAVHATASFVLADRFYKRLTPEQQEVVRVAGQEAATFLAAQYDQAATESIDKVVATGVVVTIPEDYEEWVKRGQPIIDAYLGKYPDAKGFVEGVRNAK